MDVSAEAADLVVKEGLQATETAVKLAGSGIKNVAALLLALSKQDYKVIGAGQRRAAGPRPKSSRSRSDPCGGPLALPEDGGKAVRCAVSAGPQARGRQRPYYHRFDADLCRKSQLYYGRAGLPRARSRRRTSQKKQSPSLRPRKPRTSEGVSRQHRRRGLRMMSDPLCWGSWRPCGSSPPKETRTA